ncbi:MAG: alkaline phosphatase family protein [Deltaproteobacteria bacterium]|nr:alkaline phosphatase family protein [Deltaproteobacteria bacterium]
MLIGLDGADYEVVQAMRARGELPSISALAERGTFGPLETLTAEPRGTATMQWTSVATGHRLEQHGIIEDYVRSPEVRGERGPIHSGMWMSAPIWETLSERGLRVGTASWPGTWPARPVNGLLAAHYTKFRSHEFSYEAAVRRKLQLTMTGSIYSVADLQQTHPPEFLNEILPMIERAEALDDNDLRRVLPTVSKANRRIFFDFKWNYVASEIQRDLALRLIRDPSLDFVAVVLHGLDPAFHRGRKVVSWKPYWSLRHPVLGPLADEYYRYVDGLLGELVAAAGPDAIVLVVSQHGTSGRRHSLVAIDGIFAAAGPGIMEGLEVPDATILDVVPTTLHVIDQPVPEGLPGRVLETIFSPKHRESHPIRLAPGPEPIQPTPLPVGFRGFDSAIYDRLVKIGFVLPEGETPPEDARKR